MARRKRGVLIDATDARIISLVQQDGRLPNTAIAKAVGLSEAAVRKRLDRLVGEQIIHFRAHADPLKIGFQIWAIIEIQTEAALTTRVAEKVAELPGIIVVGLVAGNYDVYAVGLFRSTEEFNEIIIERLRKIRGVTRTSTSYITKAIKRDFAFGVPILEARRSRGRGRGTSAARADEGAAAASGRKGAGPRAPGRAGATGSVPVIPMALAGDGRERRRPVASS